jgi:hypothetical protein
MTVDLERAKRGDERAFASLVEPFRRELLFETLPGGVLPGQGALREAVVYFLPMLAMWGFSTLLLISQRDLGMSTLFFGVFIIMLYLASGRIVYVVAGAVMLALAAVIGTLAFILSRSRAAALTEKDKIVLADFVNTTGEPVFDGSLRQALRPHLEQSPFLNVLADRDVADVLKQMARPSGVQSAACTFSSNSRGVPPARGTTASVPQLNQPPRRDGSSRMAIWPCEEIESTFAWTRPSGRDSGLSVRVWKSSTARPSQPAP